MNFPRARTHIIAIPMATSTRKAGTIHQALSRKKAQTLSKISWAAGPFSYPVELPSLVRESYAGTARTFDFFDHPTADVVVLYDPEETFEKRVNPDTLLWSRLASATPLKRLTARLWMRVHDAADAAIGCAARYSASGA